MTRSTIVVSALVLASLAVVVRPSSAAFTFLPATIAAAPGTVSGTVDRLYSSDDVRVTWSEADPTNLVATNRWLKPVGDGSPLEFGEGGASGCAPATVEYCYVDDDPVHDGNTSFLFTTGSAVQSSRHEVTDVPTDITVTGLTVWVVARKNSSANDGFTYGLTTTGGDCTQNDPSLTEAFGNYSSLVLGCPDALTGTIVNSARVKLSTPGCTPLPCPIGQTVTAEGLTISYTDRDYQVAAYVNFTDVQGFSGYDLDFEGSTSLSGETLELQVLQSGGYVTVVAPFLSASETAGQYNLDPARDVLDQAVSFRIIDSSTNDETGESFQLDAFAIAATSDGGGSGPGQAGEEGFFRVRCEPRLTTVWCSVALDPAPPGIRIRQTRWSTQGNVVVVDGEALKHDATIPQFTFPKGNLTVSVSVLLTTGIRVDLERTERVDHTWIVAILLVVVVVIPLGLLFRRVRRRAREQRRKRNTKEERKEFWRRHLFP